MAEKYNKESLEKAELFFQRAQKVASSGNYEYAIEMYLEGLKYAPEEINRGHVPLYDLALKRKSEGGKKPTVMEKVKKLRAKEPLERMINSEYLLAKDPDNLNFAENLLKAAKEADLEKVVLWIADLAFQKNNSRDKPSVPIFLLLKDTYKEMEKPERALAALRCAIQRKPEDRELAVEYKNLTAELAMSKGKYDMGEDFRVSIKNRQEQEELQAQKANLKSEDFQQKAIDSARKQYQKDPSSSKNIFNLANTLAKTKKEELENEAISLLAKAADEQKNFAFEQRAGEIRINQLKRKLRKAQEILEKNPGNQKAKENVDFLSERIRKFELHFYKRCEENYPTDRKIKYQYASRLMDAGKFDEAIPLLQEAQRDPKYKIRAMNKIGLCFYEKQWYPDAVDIFKNAIESHKINSDEIAKNLQYNLAKTYEAREEKQKAFELYRKIAQIDFAFRDVRDRVDILRKELTGPTSQ